MGDLKPIHTHLTRYYLVQRPLLWFAQDEKVPVEKIQEFFTEKGISDLLKFGYLVITR